MARRNNFSLPFSMVTPKSVYLNRRALLGSLLALPGAAAATQRLEGFRKTGYGKGETLTPYEAVTTYNNFYEFGASKDDPARNGRNFRTRPWTVRVDGEALKPRTFDLDEILKLAPLEERIYRFRCVEGWSMVIPWIGFPLAELLKQVEPKSSAQFVAFETYFDPRQMPQSGWSGIPFPYLEGLRLDEALRPLTILAAGLYGEVLPNQNGAPLRLVVPWKYGFKSIKSVVRIRLVKSQPPTTWSLANPREYGFYSNVNPDVDHPRWSQSKERRIGEFFKRDTLLFNGYGSEVASLYAGMDLRRHY